MLADWLCLEPLIKTRLADVVDDSGNPVRVFSAADLEGVRAATQHTPAIHVLFDRYQLAEQQGKGLVQAWDQIWSVIVVVRNVRRAATGEASRADAGPIIGQVLARLQGWLPNDGEHGPLMPTNPSYRAGNVAGTATFPFSFATRVQTQGARR